MNASDIVYHPSVNVLDALACLERSAEYEIDLLSSRSFYHVPHGYDFGPVKQYFEQFFVDLVKQLGSHLGPPTKTRKLDGANFNENIDIIPECTDSQLLAVWERNEKDVYLRFSWEDQEIPMLIAIGIRGCKDTGAVYPGQFDDEERA